MDIYRDAMRRFIVYRLRRAKRVDVKNAMARALNDTNRRYFEQDLIVHQGDIEASIDVNVFV